MRQNKKVTIIGFGITILISLIILLWGLFGNIMGNELGYGLLSFYIIMPLTAFITALILGLKNAYLKILYLAGSIEMFLILFMVASIGLIIGILIRQHFNRK